MTNAEKYLKDGVDVKKFAEMIDTAYVKSDLNADVCESTINWLKEQAKQTLTEDEKAILNELPKKYKYISRNLANELQLREKPKSEEMSFCDAIDELYNHLFQFIQPRRRI